MAVFFLIGLELSINVIPVILPSCPWTDYFLLYSNVNGSKWIQADVCEDSETDRFKEL